MSAYFIRSRDRRIPDHLVPDRRPPDRQRRDHRRRWALRALLRVVQALWALAGMLQGSAVLAAAQTSSAPEQQLQQQLNTVEASLLTAQRQLDAYHSELLELRQQVKLLQHQMGSGASADLSTYEATHEATHEATQEATADATRDATQAANASAKQSGSQSAADLKQAVTDLQEQQAIQQAEIQVHEQTKIETASKYSLKLHGLVLFNTSMNDGAVDQPKLPTFSLARTAGVDHGGLTASANQSLIGVDAAGPVFWGARVYAEAAVDFSGGLASPTFISPSLLRLRTASAQMAWPGTIVEAGVTDLILTPYYATSYFDVAQAPLSWAGALWNWVPQVSVEHRFDFSERRRLTLQAAVADIPDAGTSATNTLGLVSAAERSRYPAAEVRTAFHWGTARASSVGVGGYWSPHRYGSEKSSPNSFPAWAGTADWRLFLPARLQLSGEIYDGSALGGLSAGAYKDFVSQSRPLAGNLKETHLAGLKNMGGWAQLKFRPADRFDFNLAFGHDNVNAGQLRRSDLNLSNPFTGLARNQTVFGNIIFRPHSTFLLSAEYRKIRSWQITGPVNAAQIFGLAAGYEF